MTWRDVLRVLEETLHSLYGSAAATDIVSTTAKAVLIYVFTLILVRSGKSRMLGRSTLFDIVLIFVLGSMVSRAINGSADPLPTAVAAIALVAFHALLGRITWHYHSIGKLVKGQPKDLVKDGRLLEDELHSHHVSRRDIEEAMHSNGIDKLEDIKLARLERDGRITVVPMFRVLEVEVQEGVQRIRIEI